MTPMTECEALDSLARHFDWPEGIERLDGVLLVHLSDAGFERDQLEGLGHITRKEWAQRRNELRTDAGAHYRREYKGIKLDPYRVAKIYGMAGGPREQIMKKCLRFTDKGQTEQQVVNEIRTALNRWQEMLDEDDE